jgi:hypothetical protein
MLHWQVSLLDYHGRMDVAHHSGKSHANADGPSHFPLPNDGNNLAAELDPDDAIEVGTVTIGGILLTTPGDLVSGRAPFPALLPASGSPLAVERGDHQKSTATGLDLEEEVEELEMAAGLVFGNMELDEEISFYPEVCVFGTVTVVISMWSLTDTLHQAITKGYKADPVFHNLYDALVKNDLEVLNEDTDSEIWVNAKQGNFCLLDGLIYRRKAFSPVSSSRIQELESLFSIPVTMNLWSATLLLNGPLEI